MNNQSGQTLIETLVAAFILVMGISAALSLATYSLGATTSIKQQTIAIGLAREGIEITKNIRDTNWLKGNLTATCYDFLSQGSQAYCYQDWLNPASGDGQNISAPGTPRRFSLIWDPSQVENPWRITPTETDFGLNLPNFQAMGENFQGVYYTSQPGLSVAEGNSGYGRAITITEDNSFAPFNRNTGPRLKVTSQVWWGGKGCPSSNLPPTDEKCSVTLETYLTNWRNF